MCPLCITLIAAGIAKVGASAGATTAGAVGIRKMIRRSRVAGGGTAARDPQPATLSRHSTTSMASSASPCSEPDVAMKCPRRDGVIVTSDV